MTISRPLLERLVVTKYLVTQAAATLGSSAPFSAGIAVGQLQDAVELFLRLLGEHLHAQVKEKMAFDQVVETINAAIGTPLSHRTALVQLNKARVNFKHFGLDPRLEDAQKLLQDMQFFLPTTCSAHLGVDYETISIASLVGYLRTENWLRKAEGRLSEGDYSQAVDFAAIALATFQRHLATEIEPIRLDRFGSHADLRDLIDSIQDEFHELYSTIDLMLTGASLAQYRLFRQFAPRVAFTMANTFFLSERGFYDTPPTSQQVSACLSFALDAILALKKAHVPREGLRRPAPETRPVQVLKEANVVIYPGDEEVIKAVGPGDQLLVAGTHSKSGFAIVVFDDELFFVDPAALAHDGGGAA